MKPADLYEGQTYLTSERGLGTIGLEKNQISGFEGFLSNLAKYHIRGAETVDPAGSVRTVTLQSLPSARSVFQGTFHAQTGQWPMAPAKPPPPNCSGGSPLLILPV